MIQQIQRSGFVFCLLGLLSSPIAAQQSIDLKIGDKAPEFELLDDYILARDFASDLNVGDK
jgi:hypothetical protein